MGAFQNAQMAVLGEAIIDLLPTEDGSYLPSVGGSPYNLTRALGRQAVPVCYLSPFSTDGFGRKLRKQLKKDGVALVEDFVVDNPSSLAVVSLDKAGMPNYSLYRDGIADREYTAEDIISRLPTGLKLFHTGSLAIVPDELAKITEIFEVLKARDVAISIDLNVRPNVVPDHHSYVEGVKSLIPYANILKASDEDLRFMGMDDIETAGSTLLEKMPKGIVTVTLGDKGAHLCCPGVETFVPAFEVSEVKDSIGAGDCFHAGFLSALYHNQWLAGKAWQSGAKEIMHHCLYRAAATAAINVSRSGCNPPTLHEVEQLLSKRGAQA